MGIDIMRGSLGSRWRWIYSWRALYHHSCSPALYPTTHWNGLRSYWSARDMVPKGHWTLCDKTSPSTEQQRLFWTIWQENQVAPRKTIFHFDHWNYDDGNWSNNTSFRVMFLLETGDFPSSFRCPSQKHHWVAVRVFRSLKWSITCCMFHPNVVMTTEISPRINFYPLFTKSA